MSYAIIRNSKYNTKQLHLSYRHNERKNNTYSNKDIKHNERKKNYALKECNCSYNKKFNEIKKKCNLQGYLKSTSNVACEYIITASPEFFEELTEEQIKRYFKTAYKFACNFKNLGEEYIISAKVHMDESTPHMHLVYVPVVHTTDKKTGQTINKLCCSEFWKGQNSYKVLQDNFYKYITKAGFKLERGNNEKNEHIKIADLKQVTNYEVQKFEKMSIKEEKEINTNDIELIKQDYKRVIRKYNTLAKQYTKIKVISDTNLENYTKTTRENENLKHRLKFSQNSVRFLNKYVENIFKVVSNILYLPIPYIEDYINNKIKEYRKNERTERNNDDR